MWPCVLALVLMYVVCPCVCAYIYMQVYMHVHMYVYACLRVHKSPGQTHFTYRHARSVVDLHMQRRQRHRSPDQGVVGASGGEPTDQPRFVRLPHLTDKRRLCVCVCVCVCERERVCVFKYYVIICMDIMNGL